MPDLLHSFCAAWLSSKDGTNRETLNDCSRVFLIDGQAIPFVRLLSDLSDISTPAENDLLTTKTTLGDDSIHYQQLRSYELARELIEERDVWKSGSRLQVAIVGGGFSGLTAAMTFLKHTDDIDVTLFEHHHSLLPRFAGAYGRQIHPYHHLRQPAHSSIVETTADGANSYTWSCMFRGPEFLEEGGIPGVLSWKPGSVDAIIAQVRKAALEERDKFEGANRLNLRLGGKVVDLEPEVNGTRLSISWLNTKAILAKDQHTSLDKEEQETVREIYDVVILALGGMRDIATIPGQSNLEYWTPLRIQNSAPSRQCYEAAIIGAGNSAASEVFNLLLTRGDFVELLQHVQKWANGKHPALVGALKADAATISPEEFSGLLNDHEWNDLAESLERDLIPTGALYSTDMLRVTLFVSNEKSGRVFSTMNPLNRFLVLLLNRLGYVRIENLYGEGQRAPFVEQDYSVAFSAPGAYRLLFRGTDVRSPSGLHWSYVLNCAGPRRFYHELFATATDMVPYKALYKVRGDDGASETPEALRGILEKKQRILRPYPDPKPAVASGAATSSETLTR